ncbi:peptidylprolyl isomerase [Conchiformibius kuhniae]|uniref:Peptidylprolyl isomerase n=1 Tax=Conchiformibius kuhniae TaxID=211502 RepID=A0A8T9MV61_9NEIS|nr:peptidylprolyl isomerase [Conchiformibius kuhniae]UOP04376.1 peptidylprolyl isomerase [Conchiformibius kuhniae]
MNTRFVKTLLWSALFAAASAAADIRPLNGIAAEINGNIVTYGEIERMARVMRQNSRTAVPPEQLQQAARQSLFERTLMVDEARNKGLKATTAEIDGEIARRAAVAGTTVQHIYQDAGQFGWSHAQYRLEVAKDLLIEKVMADLEEDIKIDEHQIDQYIQMAQKEGKSLPAGEPYTVYQVQRIIMKMSKNNTATAVGKRMALIAQAVRQGADFGALARRYSQEPAAAQGGTLELTDEREPAKVEALLQQLKPGDTAAPVQTAHNWQFFRLTGKRTETDPVKIRREAVRRLLRKQAQEQAQQQLVERLQHNAVIREY